MDRFTHPFYWFTMVKNWLGVDSRTLTTMMLTMIHTIIENLLENIVMTTQMANLNLTQKARIHIILNQIAKIQTMMMSLLRCAGILFSMIPSECLCVYVCHHTFLNYMWLVIDIGLLLTMFCYFLLIYICFLSLRIFLFSKYISGLTSL